jgi:hypothetical protein
MATIAACAIGLAATGGQPDRGDSTQEEMDSHQAV